jgi:hypothetical protein
VLGDTTFADPGRQDSVGKTRDRSNTKEGPASTMQKTAGKTVTGKVLVEKGFDSRSAPIWVLYSTSSATSCREGLSAFFLPPCSAGNDPSAGLEAGEG